jgi:hypothetical protein
MYLRKSATSLIDALSSFTYTVQIHKANTGLDMNGTIISESLILLRCEVAGAVLAMKTSFWGSLIFFLVT